MRNIIRVILHCAVTRTDQNISVEDIRRWHTDPKPKGNGWSDIGYHYYIRLDGTIEIGRPLNIVGSHARGRNTGSIGICFEGGLLPSGEKWHEPMIEQSVSCKKLLSSLNVVLGKKLEVNGHYEFSDKTCPNFKIDIFK